VNRRAAPTLVGMQAPLLLPLPDRLDPVDQSLLETARRKAFYARVSAAEAELLKQDHSISRPEYDRRLEAAHAAEHALRLVLGKVRAETPRPPAREHPRQ